MEEQNQKPQEEQLGLPMGPEPPRQDKPPHIKGSGRRTVCHLNQKQWGDLTVWIEANRDRAATTDNEALAVECGSAIGCKVTANNIAAAKINRGIRAPAVRSAVQVLAGYVKRMNAARYEVDDDSDLLDKIIDGTYKETVP